MASKKKTTKKQTRKAPRRNGHKGGACLCGCGEEANRHFLQGHDARMASLILAVGAGKTGGMNGGQVRRVRNLVEKKHPALQTPHFRKVIAKAGL